MESFSDSVNVVRVKACNRDSAVSGHVNMMVVLQRVDLLSAEACEGEHTNLTSYVAPVVRASVLLEFIDQATSHFFNSSRHCEQVLMPACSQFWIIQDDIDDSCTMDWWIGIHWSGNTLNS